MQTTSEAIETTRTSMVVILENLLALWGRSNLGSPTDAITLCIEKLKENRYTVMIAGEAKRGKSSFVNAMLGDELLPTDLSYATSQVFRIRNREEESYHLLFEDESRKAIKKDDLATYGAQYNAETSEVRSLSDVIRYIEVDFPINFLPPEIELLDTPGLGSIFSEHAAITYRFTPFADGVIFMLSSNHPVTSVEVEFIKTLAEVTPHIFFVQTMIDLHGREVWETILNDNKRILKEKFGDTLSDIQVWPLSNKNLKEAVESDDDDFLQISKFPALVDALNLFLFKSSGWNTLIAIISTVRETIEHATNRIKIRSDDLHAESKVQRKQNRQRISDLRERFNENWGNVGSRREELFKNIKKDISLARQEFKQSLHPTTGTIAREYRKQIEGIATLNDIQEYENKINDKVLNSAGESWEEIKHKLQGRINGHFVSVSEAFKKLKHDLAGMDSVDAKTLRQSRGIEASVMDLLKTAFIGARMVGSVTTIGALCATFVFPAFPLVILVGAPLSATVLGMIREMKRGKGKQLDQAKDKLNNHLQNIMQDIQQEFFKVNLEEGKNSIVEGCFESSLDSVQEQLDGLYRKIEEELQVEMKSVEKLDQLTQQEKREEAGRLSKLASEWKEQETLYVSITDQLTQIKQVLSQQEPTG